MTAKVPPDFEPHLRKSPVTDPWEPLYAKREGEAFSLGLWIAARLAEAMGGGLAAEGGAVRAWFGALPRQRHPGNVV